MSHRSIVHAALACFSMVCFRAPLMAAPDRVALVIGNSAYGNGRGLPNATNDSAAVARLLTSVGFDLITVPTSRTPAGRGLENATVEQFAAALDAFKAAAKNARVGLVYYAGHGLEVDGKNYLLPVDAALEESSQLRTQAFSVESVLAEMKEARLPSKMLILDCCRDNPLKRSWLTTRSLGGGLAELKEESLPESTLVMYSTAPGKAALDGTGQNSPFTAALVQHLGAPDVSVFDAFIRVSDSVALQTHEAQVPWIKFDGGGRTFRNMTFAVGPQARTSPIPPTLPAAEEMTNSLGMKFVKVPGTHVAFCIHETRRQDYAAYANAKTGVDDTWRNVTYKEIPVGHQQTHPVVNVSWEDAQGFCAWLSRKEGKTYRLPTDREWSVAVGIGENENASVSASDLSMKLGEVYPWAGPFTASAIDGNYADEAAKAKFGTEWRIISHYRDGYPTTAPVMSFSKNEFGIYDLGGNVWEWCEDSYKAGSESRVLRGGSWLNEDSGRLLSSFRSSNSPARRYDRNGFRVVLSVGGGG